MCEIVFITGRDKLGYFESNIKGIICASNCSKPQDRQSTLREQANLNVDFAPTK